MPAGRGARCEACYWSDLLRKRIEIDRAAFSTPAMASCFDAFAGWLGSTVGVAKAAIHLHRYLAWFTDVESTWGGFPEYCVLVEHFGAEGLRRVRLPMRWLNETGVVTADADVRALDSERKRIDALLSRFDPESESGDIVVRYHRLLDEKVQAGKSSVRSMRLALSPAAALIAECAAHGHMPPGQSDLEAFLDARPGQRAALCGFVRYLRENCDVDVVLPSHDAKDIARRRRQRLEAELLVVMRKAASGADVRHRWLSVCLAYFHGLPRGVVKHLGDGDVVLDGDGGVNVTYENRVYWVPRLPAAPALTP